jgi:ribosome recycling factor
MFNESVELNDYRQRLVKTIEAFKTDLSGLRTGKTSPSLVENIIVETYGGTTKMKLQELSTITSDGPQSLLVTPFDASTVRDIENAIINSPLHLSPSMDGRSIRLKIPPLTEDQRKQMTKIVSQKAEETKNKIRLGRDEIRKKVKQNFEDKVLSEDERSRVEKNIEKITQEFSLQTDTIKEKKESELMSI